MKASLSCGPNSKMGHQVFKSRKSEEKVELVLFYLSILTLSLFWIVKSQRHLPMNFDLKQVYEYREHTINDYDTI